MSGRAVRAGLSAAKLLMPPEELWRTLLSTPSEAPACCIQNRLIVSGLVLQNIAFKKPVRITDCQFERGIVFENVDFLGGFELTNCTVEMGVRLYRVTSPQHLIRLDGLAARSLELIQIDAPAISARGLRIQREFECKRCRLTAPREKFSLDLAGSRFNTGGKLGMRWLVLAAITAETIRLVDLGEAWPNLHIFDGLPVHSVVTDPFGERYLRNLGVNQLTIESSEDSRAW